MSNLKQNVAIVGIGGCGTNIAYQFEKLGYTTVHINSSSQDESAIANAKTILHLEGYNGCAGDRDKAIEAISDNQNIIDYLCALKQEILFFCFGAGGGTGSGIGPSLASIVAEESRKKVCCIVALPDSDEDKGYQLNAYECVKQLSTMDNLGCTLFVDNNKDDKKLMLNRKIASILNDFISNESVSVLGNVDAGEKTTMLSTPGNMVIISGEETTERVVESIMTDNIYAPLEQENSCEYISIMNKGTQGIDKSSLIALFGEPNRTFLGYNSSQTIVAVAGLQFPFDHIVRIGEIAKMKSKRRSQKRIVELGDLEMTDLSRVKPAPKEVVNRRELLLKNR